MRRSVPSDAELARAARDGDVASLGVLLERHRAQLYALALRMLGHGPQAQDAVQEAFLVALGTIDRLREPEAVGGWLRGITRNVCLMKLRAERQANLGRRAVYLDAEPTEPSTEEAIDRLALKEWVWTALSELPEALRITAMLRYFGGYPSYEEISAIMGVPVGTVKSRLSRVKVRLAEALLETAGLRHDGVLRLQESRTRYATDAFVEYNNGRFEGYTELLSGDAVAVVAGAVALRGREALVSDLRRRMEEDLEDGVRVRLTNLLASKNVTVVESAFDNPPDDPYHCPPAMVEVQLQRNDLIHRLHRYYAKRPEAPANIG